MPDDYNLDGRDRALLAAATILLRKMASAKTLRPAELVSVAKLQHVLSRVPKVTTELEVAISVTGTRHTFGEIETRHWWGVEVEGERLSISSGGQFYRPSTGGDTFTTMSWSALPGEPAEFNDYREDLAIVPDVQSFPDAVETIDFASGAYTAEITDADNPLLEDLEAADEDEQEPDVLPDEQEGEETDINWPLPFGSATTLDAAEKHLAATIDLDEMENNKPQYAYNAEKCDLCGCSLAERALFVDGCLRGQAMWGNMCARCFSTKGAGIRWGLGQLYARQPDGRWRMVAGFPTSES